VGLGCRYDSEEGIARIREIKRIKESSPLAVLISSLDQIDELEIRKSKIFKNLAEKLWPGGLTIVISSEKTFPCSGNSNTIGLRMPDSDVLCEIIEKTGHPLAATSANFHGKPAPKLLKDVDPEIIKKADHQIKLPIKPIGLASTVITIEAGDIRVIREGAIPKTDIIAALSEKD
jgi:L-threonylcarbamoyladenylate synthase